MATNILIVDDSGTMRTMIKRTIGMCGLDVGEIHEAANGIEALAQMHEHQIDVVLLDVNMPVMGGQKLLARIHVDESLRDIPIVIASTEGSDTRIQQLLDAGAHGFLRKPFRPEQLRDVLSTIVKAGQPGESTAATANGDDDLAF